MFDGVPPCAADPAMFFSTKPARREEAARMCATCPFQAPCRELSERPIETSSQRSYHISNGVWAGVDKSEEEIVSPKVRLQRDRAQQIRVLLSEGITVKSEIGRRLGISHSSVSNIIKNHLTEEEAR